MGTGVGEISEDRGQGNTSSGDPDQPPFNHQFFALRGI
jgi:hypothetical protein